MNDDNKDPNSTAAGSEADDNPWDDDDGGGRTLAQDSPSFELPSNIPSPITVPPPPAPIPKGPGPVRPRSPTMMGFGPMGPPLPPAAPAGPAAPVGPARPVVAAPPSPKAAPASARGVPAAPRAPAAPAAPAAGSGTAPQAFAPRPVPRVGAAASPSASLPLPSSARMAAAPLAAPPPQPVPAPAAAADEAWPEDDSDREDGPTMAGAPLAPDVPLRDDVVNPRRHSPLASTGFVDKDAETMALSGDDGDLPRIGDLVDAEETTRAVSRDELLGHHGSQIILGDDEGAHGDEATLAVAPGALGDLGIDPGLAASLSEPLPRAPSQPDLMQAPAFPPPQFPSPGGIGAAQPYPPSQPYPQQQQQQQQPQSQPQQPIQSWQGEAAPSYRNPPPQSMGGMGMQQGYDPMQPQGYDPMQPQGHQSSPGMQSAQQQGYPMQGGPGQPQPYGGPQQMQPMPGQQPWLQPQPAPGGGLAQKFTPQVIMLIVVGTVCLSIFIIGIVLFVTTNFEPAVRAETRRRPTLDRSRSSRQVADRRAHLRAAASAPSTRRRTRTTAAAPPSRSCTPSSRATSTRAAASSRRATRRTR